MLSYIKWPIVKTSLKMGLKAENYPSFTSTQMMMDTRKENNFKN